TVHAGAACECPRTRGAWYFPTGPGRWPGSRRRWSCPLWAGRWSPRRFGRPWSFALPGRRFEAPGIPRRRDLVGPRWWPEFAPRRGPDADRAVPTPGRAPPEEPRRRPLTRAGCPFDPG